MSVLTAFRADRSKAIIQAEALVSAITAEGAAETRGILETNTSYRVAPWVTRMSAAIAAAREAMTAQGTYEVEWRDDNDDVDQLTGACVRWREQVLGTLDLALTQKVPSAKAVLRSWRTAQPETDSYMQQREAMPVLMNVLNRADHAALDLRPDQLAEGARLLTEMTAERASADGAKSGRSDHTYLLAGFLDEIANLAEERAAAQRLASLRSGRELPGLDLTYIRAASAASRTPQPDDDDGDGDGGTGDGSGDRGL
jgi:hypothetical protein